MNALDELDQALTGAGPSKDGSAPAPNGPTSALDELDTELSRHDTHFTGPNPVDALDKELRTAGVPVPGAGELPKTPSNKPIPQEAADLLKLNVAPGTNAFRTSAYVKGRLANYRADLPHVQQLLGHEIGTPADPTTKLTQAYQVGDILQNRAPSDSERQDADRTFFRLWTTNRQERPSPDGMQGFQTPAYATANFSAAELDDMLAKFRNLSPKDAMAALNPLQRDTFQAIGGHAFLDALSVNQPHIVARQRLSTITGQPDPALTTQQGTFQHLPAPQPASFLAYNFNPTHLAAQDPELQRYSDIEMAGQMADAEGQRFSNRADYTSLGITQQGATARAGADAPADIAAAAIAPLYPILAPLTIATNAAGGGALQGVSSFVTGDRQALGRAVTHSINELSNSWFATNDDAAYTKQILNRIKPATQSEADDVVAMTMPIGRGIGNALARAVPASAPLAGKIGDQFAFLDDPDALAGQALLMVASGGALAGAGRLVGTARVGGQSLLAHIPGRIGTIAQKGLAYSELAKSGLGSSAVQDALLRPLRAAITSAKTLSDVKPLAERALRAIVADGTGLKPEVVAPITARVEEIARRSSGLDAALTPADRATLLEGAVHVSTLGPADALWVVDGSVKMTPAEMPAYAQRIVDHFERIKRAEPATNAPPLARLLIPERELSSISKEVVDHGAKQEAAIKGLSTLGDLTDQVTDTLTKRIGTRAQTSKALATAKQVELRTHHAEIEQAVFDSHDFDHEGTTVFQPMPAPPGVAEVLDPSLTSHVARRSVFLEHADSLGASPAFKTFVDEADAALTAWHDEFKPYLARLLTADEAGTLPAEAAPAARAIKKLYDDNPLVEPPKPASFAAKEAEFKRRLAAETDPDKKFDIMAEFEAERKKAKLGTGGQRVTSGEADLGPDYETRPVHEDPVDTLAREVLARELEDAIKGHASRVWDAQPKTTATEILPNPDPARTALRQRVADKVTNAKAMGNVIRLTEAEKGVLNTGKVQPSTFEPPLDALRAIKEDHKNLQLQHETDLASYRALRQFSDDLQTHKLGDRLKVPKEVDRVLRNEVGTTDALFGDKYESLDPLATHGYNTGIQRLDEAIGLLKGDMLASRLGLRIPSILDNKILAASGPDAFGPAVRSAAMDVDAYQRFRIHQGRAAARALGKDFTVAEGLHELNELANGRPSKLTDSSHFQNLRASLLFDKFYAGQLSAEELTGLISNPKYYHGYMVKDARAIVGKPAEHPLPGRWSPLSMSEGYMQAKIPEGPGVHVTWEDPKLGTRFKEFPGGLDDAHAWLNSEEASNLIADRAVAIRNNLSFPEKVAGLKDRTLQATPGISAGTLIQEMASDNAHALLSRTIARTPFATDAIPETFTRSSLVSHLQMALDPATGKKWFKVDAPGAGDLYGKWVHQDAIDFLGNREGGLAIWREVARHIEKRDWNNPLLGHLDSAALKIMGGPGAGGPLATALKGVGRLYSAANVALSASSWMKQWSSNLFYSMRAAGIETLDPTAWPSLIRFAKEGLGELWQESGATHNRLLKHGNIEYSPRAMMDEISTQLRDYNGHEGLGARRDFLLNQSKAAQLAGNTDVAAKLMESALKIDETLHKEMPGRIGDFMGRLHDAFTSPMKTLDKGLAPFWKSFQIPDNLTKYIAFRHLTEVQGLAEEVAHARLDKFFPHLHRTSGWIRNLNSSALGAQFTNYPAEQLRVIANTARERPAWMLLDGAARYAFNRAMLNTGGSNADSDLASFAYTQYGTHRTGFTDAHYMLGRILFPGGRGGINLGPAGWDVLDPLSPWGRSWAARLRETSAPNVVKAAANAGLGIVSKFAMGSAAFGAMTSLLQQRDERGMPYDTLLDSIKDVGSKFVPGLVRDGAHFYQAAAGTAANAWTGKPWSVRQYFQRSLGLEDTSRYSEEVMLGAALQATRQWIGNPPLIGPGHSMYKEVRTALFASDNYNGAGGFKDPARVPEQIKTLLAGRQADYPTLYGDATHPALNPAEFQKLRDRTTMAGVLDAYNQLPIVGKAMAVVSFKDLHPGASPEFTQKLDQLFAKDLLTGSVSVHAYGQAQEAKNKVLSDLTASPEVKAAANHYFNAVMAFKK